MKRFSVRCSRAAKQKPDWLKSCKGQATLEYLIVGVALIGIIVALGVFSGRIEEGILVQHAADSASHAMTTNTAGSIGDVLLY